MSTRYFTTLLAVTFSLMLFLPANTYSQVIEPTGTSQEASSQLIYYYNDVNFGSNTIQVTNTNDTESVAIHVQIFRNFDESGPGTGSPATLCDERDFIDSLTPNDTHVYEIQSANFPKNMGESETTPGDSTSIILSPSVETEGFIIITPVVSDADLTAISFQYLMGSMKTDGYGSFNAMGRAAVNFTTGDIAPVNTPLDGVTNGFVLLQPSELEFNFEALRSSADIIGIAFTDNYGDAGLQGYTVTPGSSTWTSFLFDWKEDPTSCGSMTVSCYTSVGLNDDVPHYTQSNFGNQLLCEGASTPDHSSPSISNYDIGWTRIFVSGLDDNENLLGVTSFDSPFADVEWMSTNR